MHRLGTHRQTLRISNAAGPIATAFVALLALGPIATVLWSLTAKDGVRLDELWSTVLPDYVATTLSLMALAGAFSAVIGIATAWLVVSSDFPGRRVFAWLLVAPLAAPAYVVGYLYTDLIEYSGPVQTWLRFTFGWDAPLPPIRNTPGAAIMLGLVLYPYVYLLARSAFAAQSHSQLQAARSLGLSPWAAFVRVVLPAARPAIMGGVALVLMEVLADFAVADHFGLQTMSTGVFRTWLGAGERTAALQLSAIMLIFVALLIALEAANRRGRVESADRLASQPTLFRLGRWGAAAAVLVCAAPIVFGFVIPLTMLVFLSVTQGDGLGSAALAGYAGASLTVAVAVAAIATALGLFLAYAQRAGGGPDARAGAAIKSGLIRAATLGYALPGALLAVGLLAPLGAFDQSLTRWSRATFGLDHGLLLTGTIAVLVYALVVRFLTVSFNAVSGGMTKIPLAMDNAARSLNAGPWTVIRRIHVPLLAPSLASGAALVFIDVMRELPATLILRPGNMETLATRVYRLASDERIAEASTAALIIVLTGLVAVVILNRSQR